MSFTVVSHRSGDPIAGIRLFGEAYKNGYSQELGVSGDDGRCIAGNFLDNYPGSIGRSSSHGMISCVTDRDLHFARHPLYITTPVVSDTEATVAVQAEIACNLRTERLKVHTVVRDADGTLVADDTTHIAWNRKMKVYEYRLDDIHLSHPRLWSCETPHLYRLTAELCDEQGRVADQVESRFGVRTIEYGPDFGFKLNGKKVLQRGLPQFVR